MKKERGARSRRCSGTGLQSLHLWSQGSVKSFLGSSTGWWADTTATLLPGKKEITRGTTEKINTEPRGPT